MSQISNFYDGLFPRSKFDLPADAPNVEDVRHLTRDPGILKFYTFMGQNAVIPKTVSVYGTDYRKGQILLLGKQSLGVLKVGIVRAIGYCGNEVSFGLSTYEAKQSKYGYYVSTKSHFQDEVVKLSDLWDYHPLELIGSESCFIFVLHHFISEHTGNNG